MKKTWVSVFLFLLLAGAVGFSAAEAAPAVITAGSPDATLLPFGQNQAIAVQYLDAEHQAELLLADPDGVQKSIRFPCERGDFHFVPSMHKDPEFLAYQADGNLLTWYTWKADELAPLRTWDDCSALIAKKEGLLLERFGPAQGLGAEELFSAAIGVTKSLEFVDMQQQTVLSLDIPQSNVYFDDVIWDDDGWIFLSRQAFDNLYAVQRVSPEGDFLWKLDLPEIYEVDGFFSDGANGLWLTHSPAYAGDMVLHHVNANGGMDQTLRLSGERRVKYMECGQTPEPGKAVLYGTSVARSKGICHAFALTLSSAGDVLNLEVRNYTERKDYGIEIKASADGTVYVYSGIYENTSPLLVPFVNLQNVINHGLSVYEN